MEKINYALELNNLIKNQSQGRLGFSAEIIDGEIISAIANVISEKISSSRVAILYTEETFKKYQKPLSDAIKKKGARVFNLVVEPTAMLSINDCSNAVIVPDDVRAYVTLDNSLVDLVKYVATVKNVIAIYGDVYYNPNGVLDNKCFIENGNAKDEFYFDAPLYMAMDTNSVALTNPAKNYIQSVTYLSALTDYRVYSAVKGKACNKGAYLLIKDAVASAYKILNCDKNERDNILYKTNVYAEVGAYLSGGIVKDVSGVNGASKYYLLSNGKTADAYTCLQIFIHVLKIYAVGLKNSGEFLGINNYVSNLNDLAVKCKIDDGVLVKKLNAQLKDVLKNGKTAQTIIDGLAKEVNSQINTLKTIEKTFFSLGGKAHKAGKINTFIKNGALFSAYGALGFLLEKGILDLVD